MKELHAPASGSLGKRILLVVAKTFGYVLLSILIALPFFLGLVSMLDPEALRVLQSSDLSGANPWILSGTWLVLLAGSVAAAVFFRRIVDKQPLKTVGWGVAGAPAGWARGALLGIGFITIGFLVLWAAGWLRVRSVQFEFSVLLAWVVFFLIQTTYEEIVFRGYLLRMTAEYFNPVTGLVVTSLLFALVHGPNENFSWLGLLNILLAGFVLGVLVLRTGKIWAAAGLHFTWNLFQSVVYGFPVSGMETYQLLDTEVNGPAVMTGGGFGLEGSVLMVLVLGGYLWRHRDHLRNTSMDSV